MSEKKIPYKIYLEESEMPKEWYNVRADMKNKPAPVAQSGYVKADDGGRTGRCILRGTGKTGAG